MLAYWNYTRYALPFSNRFACLFDSFVFLLAVIPIFGNLFEFVVGQAVEEIQDDGVMACVILREKLKAAYVMPSLRMSFTTGCSPM